MNRSAFMLLCLAFVSCGTAESKKTADTVALQSRLERTNLVQPEKIETKNIVEINDKIEMPIFVKYYMSKLKIEIAADVNVSRELISTRVGVAIEFLHRQFGSPIDEESVVTVRVGRYLKHDMTLLPGGGREMNLDSFEITGEYGVQYIIHEFFHAFYQPRSYIRSNPEHEIESWATYAQHKYLFERGGKTNKEASRILRSQIPPELGAKEIDRLRNTPFRMLPPSQQKIVYIWGATQIFDLDDDEIFRRYRNIRIADYEKIKAERQERLRR